jgi:AGZA family xanthine/uracil permease-like MFS transporter
VLVTRKIPGAIILSILGITILGIFIPNGTGSHITVWPHSIFSLPASPEPVMLKLNFTYILEHFAKALPIMLTLLIVDMFDNIGTLIGVTKRAGLMKPDGTLPKVGRALISDSIAAIVSALSGTSTVVSYIESASGVEAGGRTGLTALTTATCFLLALFFSPLILAIPTAATAPALVIVGIFMMQSVIEIKMSDFSVAAPVVITILAIPLSFSVAEGLGLGLICAAIINLVQSNDKKLSVYTYGIAGIFFLELFKLWPFNS